MNSVSITSGIESELKGRIFVVQDYSLLVIRSFRNIFTSRRYFADLIEQMDVIGVGSLRIVIVALLCVGGVVVLNAASQFRRFGETALTADAVSLALIRELGPVFTALLVGSFLIFNTFTVTVVRSCVAVTAKYEPMMSWTFRPPVKPWYPATR